MRFRGDLQVHEVEPDLSLRNALHDPRLADSISAARGCGGIWGWGLFQLEEGLSVSTYRGRVEEALDLLRGEPGDFTLGK